MSTWRFKSGGPKLNAIVKGLNVGNVTFLDLLSAQCVLNCSSFLSADVSGSGSLKSRES